MAAVDKVHVQRVPLLLGGTGWLVWRVLRTILNPGGRLSVVGKVATSHPACAACSLLSCSVFGCLLL